MKINRKEKADCSGVLFGWIQLDCLKFRLQHVYRLGPFLCPISAGRGSREHHHRLIISATMVKSGNTGMAKIGNATGVPSRDYVITNSKCCIVTLYTTDCFKNV